MANEASSARGPVELRVGDAERHDAAERLQKHFAEGRLTWEELDERLKSAYEARTRPQLDALFVDLPAAAGRVSMDKPQPAPVERRGWDRAVVMRTGSMLLVMAGIVTLVAGVHIGWVFFPMLMLWWRFAAGLPHGPRHAHGSPRTRFGNPYAPGGNRHHEVQHLRERHRHRHSDRDLD